VESIVALFDSQRSLVGQFLDNVDTLFSGSEHLMSLAHSVKKRVKTSDPLRDKLARKIIKVEEEGKQFDITRDNLYSKITDLAGYRILHLHTHQMDDINKEILRLLDEAQYPILEKPKARIWDEESKSYFEKIGIETVVSPNLYSSVHYVIETSFKTKFTCEIQVRTLAEELWGEVDHTFNYPDPSDSLACREQIRVLARAASTCSRLVDSIFSSYADFDARKNAVKAEAGATVGAPSEDSQNPSGKN
jgi:ppGpp synthetase/RelA/SpoT-type nucleotidyltranferase